MRPAGRAAMLVALWLLAWGEASAANLLSGIVLAAALLLAFPAVERNRARLYLSPGGVGRLALHVLGQLVKSNALVAREILSRRANVRTGVVAYNLQHPSDETLALMAYVLALSPGTMTIDVTRQPAVLYVHFLLLQDATRARREIARLEALVVDAIGGAAPRPERTPTTPPESP